MPQAEILGAASAANNLLETAIRIIRRLRQAYDRQKEFAGVLATHVQELQNIERIIKIVRQEGCLQTDNIKSELHQVQNAGNELVAWLRKVEQDSKSPVKQFSHQLMHGSKDERALNDIMTKLSRVKSNLFLHIQVAAVGVSSTFGEAIVANTEVIHRIDRTLQQIMGVGQGLKIAQLLRGRTPRSTSNA